METPIVGVVAPGNNGIFPTQPWQFFDLIFGAMLGVFGPLVQKVRNGDCWSRLANLGTLLVGLGSVWDMPLVTSSYAIINLITSVYFALQGMRIAADTCISQYNFSVQNPWKLVFYSKG
jgi:hypothetical protein